MKHSRWAFWLLLVLAILITGWWLCFVPYNPKRLYAAIPMEAEYIGVSRDVASRWDTFLQNPLTRSLIISMGADPEELEELSDDEDLQFWMQNLFSDELVMANVPAYAAGYDNTWIITTWLGGKSLYYRWLLPWIHDKRLSKVTSYGGRTIWRYDTAKWDFPHPLFFALVEGGMIGCMSPYGSTIHYVLDTYDGRLSTSVKPFTAWLQTPSDECDRGWIRLPADAAWPACTYALSDIGSNSISGSIGVEAPWIKPGGNLSALHTNTLSRLLGDLPLAAIVTPFDMSQTEWLDLLPVEFRKVLIELTAGTKPQVGMAALMGDEYSGRFKGLKLPGIVLGFQMEKPGQVLNNAQHAIDQLNARYKWGLIAGNYPVGDKGIYVIESTADTPYAMLNATECMAFTALDDWFLVAGSANTLRKLVARYGQPAARIEAHAGRWNKAFHPEQCAGFGWLDLMAGGKAVRNALAAWSLKLMIEDAGNSQKQRQQLNEIRAWLEGLGPMETCWIWMDAGNGWSTFRFRMGTR